MLSKLVFYKNGNSSSCIYKTLVVIKALRMTPNACKMEWGPQNQCALVEMHS